MKNVGTLTQLIEFPVSKHFHLFRPTQYYIEQSSRYVMPYAVLLMEHIILNIDNVARTWS